MNYIARIEAERNALQERVNEFVEWECWLVSNVRQLECLLEQVLAEGEELTAADVSDGKREIRD